MMRGLSPQRQRRLDHAPDVRFDEGERSARQIAVLVLGDVADLGGANCVACQEEPALGSTPCVGVDGTFWTAIACAAERWFDSTLSGTGAAVLCIYRGPLAS
jgi:hypothetical protein